MYTLSKYNKREVDSHINKTEKEEYLRILSIFEQFDIFVNMKCNDFLENNTISDSDHMQFVIETLRLKNKVHEDYRLVAIRFQLDVDIATERFKTRKKAWKNSDFFAAKLKLAIEDAAQSASEIISDSIGGATNNLMAIIGKYKICNTMPG